MSKRWHETRGDAAPKFQSIYSRYVNWNMGLEGFRAFKASMIRHATTEMGWDDPEVWGFHTQVVTHEYDGPRLNALRFFHYLKTSEWRIDVFRQQLAEGLYKDTKKKFEDDTPYVGPPKEVK